MKRPICLVTPGHLASNPRIVKEADALWAAGYQVRVVAADYMAAIRPLDEAVLGKAAWQVRRVRPAEGWSRSLLKVRRRACSWLIERGLKVPLSMSLWAENDMVGPLAAAAAESPADLYIGHYLPGLAAAAWAARVHRGRLGFDAEDSHVDELPDEPCCRARREARARMEAFYLPRCDHLSASSPMIAEGLRRRYGVVAEVLLNVFPLAEGPSRPELTAYQRGQGPPTLYWFSQTIGPGRGLEPVIDALSRTASGAHLHLRGLLRSAYRAHLARLAEGLGLAGRLHFHEPAPPDQMAVASAGHDLGLALEMNEPPNRAICLTNKVFTYLLAGVPTLMSRTVAQERLASELGPAATLIDLARPDETAAALDGFLRDPARQKEARAEAWRHGRGRFNWDREQQRLLGSVERALGGAA